MALAPPGWRAPMRLDWRRARRDGLESKHQRLARRDSDDLTAMCELERRALEQLIGHPLGRDLDFEEAAAEREAKAPGTAPHEQTGHL